MTSFIAILSWAACTDTTKPTDSETGVTVTDSDTEVTPDTDTVIDTDTTEADDPDADGLTNAQEAAAGTDPNRADTDADGLDDGDEVGGVTDPIVADTDGDGLNDGDEIASGADPLDTDTDGDGLLDGADVAAGGDPTKVDTDGDGLDDAADVAAGGSPALVDTDGDGLDDPTELADGTALNDSDSDNDQLLDGDEKTIGTDPWDFDTDEDELIDGLEAYNGTDPLNADSDADGLTDGAELYTWFSDPLNVDGDGDGLLDGDEVANGTSPGLADTDADGLDDPTEVAGTYGTDPANADTDFDTLNDGDEVLVYFTDPLLADTDGGTLLDGLEVSAGTDPHDLGDDVCTWPVVAVSANPGPGGATIFPTTVTVEFDGLYDALLLHDFSADDDGDGGYVNVTASTTFHFQDAAGIELCSATWDVTRLTAGTKWETDTSGSLFTTWDLNLRAAEVSSDCPPIDFATWDFTTVQDLLASLPLEIGVGTQVEYADDAETALTGAGEDFAADWAPFVMGAYLKGKDAVGFETGYARMEDSFCGSVTHGAYVPAAAVGEDLDRGRVTGYALHPITLEALTTSSGGAGGVFVGKFDVNDGPAWGTNPPTYSCIEACALLFGGVDSDYDCSTNQANVNFKAFVSGFADATFCTNPVDQDYKKNTNYNCGAFGCAYSAYVQDNCFASNSINYCFTR